MPKEARKVIGQSYITWEQCMDAKRNRNVTHPHTPLRPKYKILQVACSTATQKLRLKYPVKNWLYFMKTD